ncbi:monocarboxylate transporter 11-like [Asterias rubens]|uniref:monocarboxylate transporter 11-like n=1 Tax=Asterias rubens TaxID=7604 RepID=UPI001455B92C|nr:monocarboxylate transporter 11-like [Asterias rubens]
MERISKSVDWIAKAFKDGGRNGWLAVMGLFSTWMVWIGLIKGLAVMLPTLQEQFNASTWLVGWMIAIIDASIECSGICASPLRNKFGLRAVVTVSGVLVGGSLIASSFASSLYQIAILLTLFAGPAIGVSSIVTREAISHQFSDSLTMALSLGGLGSSLAYVIIIPLTQFLIDVYGWRGTMLLTGGVYSHIAVCGALMKEPATTRSNDEYAAVAVVKETAEGESAASNSRCCSCQNSVSSFISKTLKKRILSSAPFWLIVFMMNIWMMIYQQHSLARNRTLIKLHILSR